MTSEGVPKLKDQCLLGHAWKRMNEWRAQIIELSSGLYTGK